MTTQTPPRNLSKFYLPLNSSINAQPSPPLISPINAIPYSPFISTEFGSSIYEQSFHRWPGRAHVNRLLQHAKIFCGSLGFWLSMIFFAFVLWTFNAGRDGLDFVRVGSNSLKHELLDYGVTRGLHFYPANHMKIRCVGRWIMSPNSLRKDGTFPGKPLQWPSQPSKDRFFNDEEGVYFDVKITNTSLLFLSLNNHPMQTLSSHRSEPLVSLSSVNPGHIFPQPLGTSPTPAPPISLLTQTNQEDLILLHNCSGLVPLHRDLNRSETYTIRVSALMGDGIADGDLEFRGLWLNRGGRLLHVNRPRLPDDTGDDSLDGFPERLPQLGVSRSHSLTEKPLPNHYPDLNEVDHNDSHRFNEDTKIIEIVSDSPGPLLKSRRLNQAEFVSNILGEVLGWGSLVANMFGIDHVNVGVEDMCLIQNCIGAQGNPVGLGDMFFRSGISNSPSFSRPWIFQSYTPHILLLSIGDSDYYSFETHGQEYNKSLWDLQSQFEDTYVSFVKAIRQFSYPASRSARNKKPAPASIFIVRPFRGQLEHATQGVVNRLRADGDKLIFWLDTTGWLDVENTLNGGKSEDFSLDNSIDPPRWRLNESGNRKVAVFLHMHLCRYLSQTGGKCPFLEHEVYTGNMYDPTEVAFRKYIEDEKKRRLKDLFWKDTT